MTKSDVAIAREVILAQVASDGGKGIEEIRNILPSSFPAYDNGYGSKDYHILRAIHLIVRGKDSNFRFHVQFRKGDWSPIVYFCYRWAGTKLQVSFHVPNCEEIYNWIKKGNRGFFTRWDQLSSREAVKALAELIRNGE